MSKVFVIGNWKMNLSLKESVVLARGIAEAKPSNKADVVLCPSFTSIAAVAEAVAGTNIDIGAQNVAAEETGAFTGEVSAVMLREIGCKYVIIGHSERRQYLGESGGLIKIKLALAIKHGLVPILCIGEQSEERETGQWENVLANQMGEAMGGLSLDDNYLIVAYEPVWAIGSGQTVSSEDACSAVQKIRGLLRELLGEAVSQKQCAVIYGGSVAADNVRMFVGQNLMDGVLVGSSSLEAKEFLGIIKAVTK